MAIKPKAKEIRQKALTLSDLAKYNQKILFPALEEFFLSKTEFKEFKEESFKNQDSIIKKLDTLLDEKKVREYQEEKHKKLWEIIIKSLKEHRILSEKDLEDISALRVF
ncbi:MAG: hypothetical protein KJ906_04525 [Nanoarchaeota archaeon]|nr:hypothetical protein [Nanoarchaeota archaeon]